MKPYTSFNSHILKKFGCKAYKLALSCSNSCPNRDGRVGKGGCIFCAEGSGSFCAPFDMPIAEQIEFAKRRVAKKQRGDKYIAYFQSFTSTYAPPPHIRECLLYAAEREEILAISVGTRPDCLGEEILEILSEVNKIKPLTLELGLQTVFDETADFINRQCPTSAYREAVKKLHSLGIEVVFHIILGLPGETEEMMLTSVREAVKMGADGIKLQLLHILKGTRLAELYEQGKVRPLEEEEYLAILEKCVALIPREVVLHRLTGDGDKRLLIAPKWSADKKRVLNRIRERCRPE